MRFKCSIDDITAPQLALVTALDSVFRQQSNWVEVLALEPVTVKAGLNIKSSQFRGVILDQLQFYINIADFNIKTEGLTIAIQAKAIADFNIKTEGLNIAIQAKAIDEPVKRRRARRNKSDSDISHGDEQNMAEQVA